MDFRFWKYLRPKRKKESPSDNEWNRSEEEASKKLEAIFKKNVEQASNELKTLFNTGRLNTVKKLYDSLETIYDLKLNPNPEKYVAHITKWTEACLYLYDKHPELARMQIELVDKIVNTRLFDLNTASEYAMVKEKQGIYGELPVYLPEYNYGVFRVINEKGKVSYIKADTFAEVEAELLRGGYTFVRKDEEKNLLIYFKNEN